MLRHVSARAAILLLLQELCLGAIRVGRAYGVRVVAMRVHGAVLIAQISTQEALNAGFVGGGGLGKVRGASYRVRLLQLTLEAHTSGIRGVGGRANMRETPLMWLRRPVTI